MDKIYIHDMEFYGYHGVLPEENKLVKALPCIHRAWSGFKAGGRNRPAGRNRQLCGCLCMREKIVEGQPFKLLEAVAEKLAASILALYEKVAEVTVKVTKPDRPFPAITSPLR